MESLFYKVKKDSSIGASSPVNFAILKNTLFTEHFRTAASGCCTIGAFYLKLNQIQISFGQKNQNCQFNLKFGT